MEDRILNLFTGVFICIALLIYAFLATPLYDDGFNANLIIGTPFYSDHFELYIPFFKPITFLLLPARLLTYPWSFASAAFVHVVMMAATSYFTFLVARRYVPANVAALAPLITIYALFTHETFMPTRPESLLLVAILGIVYLCDSWRNTGRIRFLMIAAVLTGALTLPMHTNASIAYIYLGLFALWQRRQLAISDWAILMAALGGSSMLGVIVVLSPNPSALVELLTEYSGDRQRFTFLVGEIRRFTFFLRPYPLLPIVLFFGMVSLTAIAGEMVPNPA